MPRSKRSLAELAEEEFATMAGGTTNQVHDATGNGNGQDNGECDCEVDDGDAQSQPLLVPVAGKEGVEEGEVELTMRQP